MMYWKGEGVATNHVEAHKWLTLSAGQGDKGSAKWAKRLEALMSKQQIEEARKLETAFVARSHDVDIDEDGRIVLPPKIRQRMGVTADDMAKGFGAVFVGKLDRFEVWKADTYDAETPDLGSVSADIRKKLTPPQA